MLGRWSTTPFLCWDLPRSWTQTPTGAGQSGCCTHQHKRGLHPAAVAYVEGVARSFRFSKENFTDGPAAKTLLPTPGSLGLILGWGTRSHTPQLSVLMPQLYIPCAATKTWHSQINEQKETGTLHLHTQSFYLNISDLFKMPLMSNFCVSSAQVKANHVAAPGQPS